MTLGVGISTLAKRLTTHTENEKKTQTSNENIMGKLEMNQTSKWRSVCYEALLRMKNRCSF